MSKDTVFSLLAVVLAWIILAGACSNPVLAGLPQEARGGLVVRFAAAQARALEQDQETGLSGYAVTGSGPSGSSFAESSAASPLSVPGLQPGSWTVTAEALDGDGIVVADGQASVVVQADQTAAADIVLAPRTGGLQVTVLWTAGDIGAPAVTAQLEHRDGSRYELGFQVGPGQATFSGAFPTGLYTLGLQLLDGPTLVASALQQLRITKNTVTSAEVQLYEPNPDEGHLTVKVTAQMNKPLEVVLSGLADQLLAGQTMTVTASCAGAANAVFTWHLNAVAQGTGATITLGAGLQPGTYRLDVTAWKPNGSTAGSASRTFRILP